VSLLQAQVQTHFSGVHADVGIRLDLTKLNDACSSFELAQVLPNTGLGPIEEVQGLRIIGCLLCGSCGALHSVEDQMARHHSQCHPSEPRPRSWEKVSAQRLNNGSAKSYFQIFPRQLFTLSEDEQIIQHYRKLVQEMWDDNDEETDIRCVNSWLRTTKWHEHVKPYKTEKLRQLVAPLSKEEFPELRPAVLKLLQLAMEAINKLPELVLQRLHTPDPDKT
jgi:hypothetical protein